MTVSAGVRYSGRNVDQTFGRYLINGTLANGTVAGTNGTPNPGSGPWLYYQDPGYGNVNVPYSTALSNPGLATTYSNFAVGNILVKNPSTGGMNIHRRISTRSGRARACPTPPSSFSRTR